MTQSCQEARELTKAEETEATIGKNTEYHRITYHIIRVYILCCWEICLKQSAHRGLDYSFNQMKGCISS